MKSRLLWKCILCPNISYWSSQLLSNKSPSLHAAFNCKFWWKVNPHTKQEAPKTFLVVTPQWTNQKSRITTIPKFTVSFTAKPATYLSKYYKSLLRINSSFKFSLVFAKHWIQSVKACYQFLTTSCSMMSDKLPHFFMTDEHSQTLIYKFWSYNSFLRETWNTWTNVFDLVKLKVT